MTTLIQTKNFIEGWEDQLSENENVVASQAFLMYYLNDGEDLHYKVINHESDISTKRSFLVALEDLLMDKVKNVTYAELNLSLFDSYEMENAVLQFGWEIGADLANPSTLNDSITIPGWDLERSSAAVKN